MSAQSPRAPREQAAAGSAHVAVLSIAPWEEYIAALQPNFPMDEARALRESLPDTLRAERQLSDVLGVGLKVALPSVTTNATSTAGTASDASSTATSQAQTVGDAVTPATTSVTTNNGTSSTTTTSTTRSRAPGDVSKVTIGSPPEFPDVLAPEKSVLDGVVGVDPFVRYAAAASLFQEVRMLQRYVRDALVPPSHKAYVMRLQVTLMPAQRRLPLDAYTTLSFVAQHAPEDLKKARSLIAEVENQISKAAVDEGRRDKRVAEIVRQELSAAEALENAEAEAESLLQAKTTPDDHKKRRRVASELLSAEAATRTSGPGVRVVPLLVSDNIEGALESNSTAVLRQFGFGLLGMLSNIGISADINKALQNLKGFVGRDLNSLLTVGQLNDNSLRVRFGAMYQASDVVGLVPRNQTVTLLVVTARKAKDVRVTAKTEFANASNGAYLTEESRGAFQDRIDKTLKRYNADVDEADPAVALMVDSVQQSNFHRFRQALQLLHNRTDPRKALDLESFAESIWLDVASILAKLPYSVTTVTLPKPWVAPELHTPSTVLAADDGKETIVRVPGAGSLRGTDVWATLQLDTIAIPSTATAFSGAGEVRFQFPSAKSIGVCAKNDSCKVNTLKIFRAYHRWEDLSAPDPSEVTKEAGISVAYRQTAKLAEEDKPVWFSVSIGAGAIVATNYTGSVRIDVTRKDKAPEDSTLSMRFTGAEVTTLWQVDAKGGKTAIPPTKGSYEVGSSATFIADFRNVHPTIPVRLILVGADKPDSYEFKVFEASDDREEPNPKKG